MQNQKSDNKPIKFFTTYFCPWAHQVQIAFNEAGQQALDQIEYLVAFDLLETGGIQHNPELLALGRKQTPTIVYKEQVLTESKELIRIIDRDFAKHQYSFIPADEKLRTYSFWVEDYIRDKVLQTFMGILIKKTVEEQDQCKKESLQHIYNLIQGFKGPYYLGEQFSSIDITMAPTFLRLFVYEKLRNFQVPETEEYAKWFEWKENVVNRKSVADSKQPDEKLMFAYNHLLNNQNKN